MPSRTALITGANRGIGHEIARQLAAAGVAVVVGSRDLAAGRVLAADALGPDARAEQLDVSDGDSVAACERRLADAGVEVDVLVNNAGLYTTTPLLAVEEHALVEALQVNFIGAWRTARAFVPGMRARRWGRVVKRLTGYRTSAIARRRPARTAWPGLLERTHADDCRRGRRWCQSQLDVARLGGDPYGGSGAPRSVQEGAMAVGSPLSLTTVRPTASTTTVSRSLGESTGLSPAAKSARTRADSAGPP